MKELKGRLEFISLWNPVKLFVGKKEIDLRSYFWKLFETLNGKPATMDSKMSSIEIKEDKDADFHVEYENDKGGILMLLKKTKGFGASNIGAYLPDMLQRLNGRKVIISIADNGIKIENDPTEKVFELYYTRNNCCKIPEEKVKELCGIGTGNCCIFCAAGSDGFECLKFDSPSARMLLDRHSKKEMRANRIGNCAIVGRRETVQA